MLIQCKTCFLYNDRELYLHIKLTIYLYFSVSLSDHMHWFLSTPFSVFLGNNSKSLIKTTTISKPNPQIKAWVGDCRCIVETGLATQHWSGKS